jgi:hypothetical protein
MAKTAHGYAERRSAPLKGVNLALQLRMKNLALYVSMTLAVAVLPASSQTPPANAMATTMAAFTKRVNDYANLRNRLEKGDARLKRTDDPAQLVAAQTALAQKIQAARPGAKAGDIFTAETRPVFRKLLNPAFKGADGAENKAAIRDDNPGAIPFKVNAPYPPKAPLSTVPLDVIKSLPVLPADVQYRFVGKHLILYDARAGLIVDVLPNAMP